MGRIALHIGMQKKLKFKVPLLCYNIENRGFIHIKAGDDIGTNKDNREYRISN